MMSGSIAKRVLSETESVCPECLKKIRAYRVAEGGSVWLEKTCPDHGAFRVEIWGMAYFVGEAMIVGGLVFWELRRALRGLILLSTSPAYCWPLLTMGARSTM